MTDDDTLAHLQARRERVADLKARLDAGELTSREFTAELAKLWGAAPGSSPRQIIDAMLEHVRQTAGTEHTEHAERVFAAARHKLEGEKP